MREGSQDGRGFSGWERFCDGGPCHCQEVPSLVGIALNLVEHIFEPDTGRREHSFAFGAVVVATLADYPDDAAVDDHHRAGPAGSHPAVEGRALDTDAPFGRLADRVLFGVDGPDAMLRHGAILMEHFLQLMPHLVAVGQAAGGADVPCGEYLVILGYDAARSTAIAGGSLRDRVAHFHEVFVPAGS